MNDPRYDAKTWAAGVVFLALAGMIGYMLPRQMASTSAPPESFAAELTSDKRTAYQSTTCTAEQSVENHERIDEADLHAAA